MPTARSEKTTTRLMPQARTTVLRHQAKSARSSRKARIVKLLDSLARHCMMAIGGTDLMAFREGIIESCYNVIVFFVALFSFLAGLW